MVTFHNLVTFKEVVDTEDGTVDRITKIPIQAPQLPAGSDWGSSTFSEETLLLTQPEEEHVHVWDRQDSWKIGQDDCIDVVVSEKASFSKEDNENSPPPSPHRSHDKPSLPLLAIPKFEKPAQSPSLPARDTSFAAWLVLAAATTFSSISIGILLSFGVFQDYYTQQPQFGGASQSAWIGVLSSGLPFMAAPLMTYLCQHYPLPRIHYVWVGWLVCVVSLVGAAFSATVPALVVTQGLLFGIGAAINDNPLLIIINTWFLRRRGIAYGILFGCCDLMGVAWSFLANYLLRKYGLRTTFLVFAGIVTFASGPCMFLLKERGAMSILRRGTASSRSRTPQENVQFSSVGGDFELIRRDTPPTRRRYYYRPIFYVLMLSNFGQALAFYLPLIFLPSYATDLGYNANKATVVLAVANFAQIIGEIGFGRLSDKINVYILVVISSTTAAVSTFLLWGLSKELGTLVVYALIFCMSGSGYMALWARIGMLFGEKDTQMVYSFLSTGRGLGAIVSGPISTQLVKSAVNRNRYGNGKYESLVFFVGTAMAISAALGFLGAFTALGNVTNWLQRRISVATTPILTRKRRVRIRD